jgi:uncharacterized membrane protein
MDNLLPKHKKELQLERIILFSDAVFAIAITLLIIEIKAPHAGDLLDSTLLNSLLNMTPKFIGFLISFLLIGQYWITHHKLFGYVENYDQKLLWINIFFLLTIVTMPFSSALYSENVRVNLAFIIYCLNVIASGIFNLYLWRYVGSLKKNLSEVLKDHRLLNYFTFRATIVPVIFLLAIPLSFLDPFFAKFTPFLIYPFLKLGNLLFRDVVNKKINIH